MSTPNSLLAYRLSAEDFQQTVAQARQTRHGVPSHKPVKTSTQVVIVSGYNSDATEAIRAAAPDGRDVVTTTYVVGEDMSSVIERVEDILRIPSKYWRLTSEDVVLIPQDSLVRRASSQPVEVVVIPEDSVVHYLAKKDYVREYKNLEPTPGDAARDLSTACARAQSAFNLLKPADGPRWDDYAAHRRDAEWTFARMLGPANGEDLAEFFTYKIKHSIQGILKCTQLSEDEQKVIADGVLPQGLEAEDDGNNGFDLILVDSFTRIFSPSRPVVVDVYLNYMEPECKIFYRVHDPAPPAEERLKIFHIRSADKPTKDGDKGWHLLFNVAARRTWGLKPEDAERIREVLFGPLRDRVSTLDAVLFIMASVGIHMQLGSDKLQDKREQDKLVPWDGPDWQLGSHLKWIGTKLRSACGPQVADEGRKSKRRRIV